MTDLRPLVDLCRQLQRIQAQATALGIFVGDRDLLDCPNCKLFEDVTVDGLLITSRIQASPPIDTGLRFAEVSPNTFQCPACAETIDLALALLDAEACERRNDSPCTDAATCATTPAPINSSSSATSRT